MAISPEKMKQVKDYGFKAAIFSVARVPNSQRVFFGASDFKVYEVDLLAPKFEPKELYSHASYVTGVALVGNTLVSGSYDGKLIWWDTQSKKEIRSHEAHSKWIRGVFASRDGKLIASIADDMVCRLWDSATGKMVKELRGHEEKTPHHFPSMLYAAAFSADSKYIATGDKVGHIVVWDIATGNQVATMEAPVMYTWDPVQRLHSIGGIRSLAFSPDGKLLAVGGMGKVGNIDHLEGKTRVEIFEWAEKKRIHEFAGDKFSGLVNHLEFSSDGEWLLGAGGAGEGYVLFFDVKGKKALRQEKAPMHIHDIAMNEAGDHFVAVGHNKLVTFEMK